MLIDRKLEIFRMAAQLRNFSEAASALGMTQPNVTQQIARLELELGTALFDRTGRQVRLTAAGVLLQHESERLFREVGELHRRVMNAANRVRHYRIGGTLTAGGFVLPELAARYAERHPSQVLDLHIGNTAEISGLLKSRVLDLALVEGPFDADFFLNRKLMDDELLPVAAPGVLPERCSAAEYLARGERFILREEGSGTRYYFDAFLARRNLPQPTAQSLITVNSFDALKLLVRGRHGITVVSPCAVADELAAGTLAASHFVEGEIRRSFDFIYLPGDNLDFAERFIAFCVNAVGAGEGGR